MSGPDDQSQEALPVQPPPPSTTAEDASTITMSTTLYQDMAEEESDSSTGTGSGGSSSDAEGEEEMEVTDSSGGDGVIDDSNSGSGHEQQEPEEGPAEAAAAAEGPGAPASPSLDHNPARPPTASSLSKAKGGHPHTPSRQQQQQASPPPPPPATYGSFLHALALGVLVVAMSFGINILNLLVYLLVRPVSRVAARRIVGGVFQAMWVNVTAYLLPRSELVLTGDLHVDPTRPAIIIANHQVWKGRLGCRLCLIL